MFTSDISVVFLLASLAVIYVLIPSAHDHDYRSRSKKIESAEQERSLTVVHHPQHGPGKNRQRHPLQGMIFLRNSGYHPEAHPSRPYAVRVDATGAFARTIDYGQEGHPLRRLADVRKSRDAKQEAIFFFVVPKTDGGHLKTLLTQCYHLRRAEKRKGPESRIFTDGILNIDAQSLKGLQKGRRDKLIDSGLVDVITTSYFFEGLLLFRPGLKGRAFTVLEHPVRRAESLYLSRGPGMEGLDLLDYIQHPGYIDNWVVRSLSNVKRGELTEEHLLVAKGILGQKFFVGIHEFFDETVKRLELYYELSEGNAKGCVAQHLEKVVRQEKKTARHIERGSFDWDRVSSVNNLDVMLYYYALELFAKQGSTMFHRPYVDKAGKPIDFAKIKQQKMLEEEMANFFGQ